MTILPIPPLAEWKRWLPSKPVLIAWAVLVLVLGWTYWSTFGRVVNAWITTDDYGHGPFVPLFALFLLWIRQGMVEPWPNQRSWWAVPFFVTWAFARWAIAAFNYDRDIDSLFPFLIGATLFLGGWRALRWAWPSILFLVFMVPLPDSVAGSLSQILQKLATVASVYSLQTLGIAAINEGNKIMLSGGGELEVAKVCSGLRMLMLFFAVCVGAVFVVRAAWWEKALLIVSAVPIALFSNIFRITMNGLLTELISPWWGSQVEQHGWIMMIVAMLLLWGEMVLVSNLLPEVSTEGPLAFGGPARGAAMVGIPQGNERKQDPKRRVARW